MKNKLLTLTVLTIILTGCSSPKHNNRIVEGIYIGYQYINGELVCVYGATGEGNAGTFRGTPPKEIGGCTNNAKINLRNNDITLLIKPSRNYIQYTQ